MGDAPATDAAPPVAQHTAREKKTWCIHSKPEWLSAQEEHAKLSRILAHRATLGPFFHTSEPLFPRGWASHATVQWVIRSSLDFLLTFEKHAGIQARIEKFKFRFETL